MPEKKFELGDYVEVKDRIRILFDYTEDEFDDREGRPEFNGAFR